MYSVDDAYTGVDLKLFPALANNKYVTSVKIKTSISI